MAKIIIFIRLKYVEPTDRFGVGMEAWSIEFNTVYTSE